MPIKWVDHREAQIMDNAPNSRLYKFAIRYLPAITTFETYSKVTLKKDIIAGLTVAVMLIPQGMAYAMLAGLPPILGLYSAIIPLVIYALFGSSHQLAVGPVAIVSLMTAASIGSIAGQDSGQYISLAITLAFMVGVIQFTMGVFRFGFIVNFLSHPVISGFTSAAAIIIGFSQLKHLFGVDIPRSTYVNQIVVDAITKMDEVHLVTLLLGVAGIILLLLLKKWKPLFPGALVVVVFSTTIVWGFDLASSGVKVVGDVPSGFPSPSLPVINFETILILLPTAFAISLISFMESISVAKVFARKNNYDIRPDQELIGLGLANLGGSFFKAFPVTGGFSRTAVNAQSGAQTTFAALFTALFITIAILFLTPLFYYLPKAILAAIIMVAIVSLIDLKEIIHLYHVKRSDLLFLVITFFSTLLVGIEEGILIGIVASLAWFIYKSTKPHFAVLGRLPGTSIYRNLSRFPEAETEEHLLILRIDSQLYFGNAQFLKEMIKHQVNSQHHDVKFVILDATGVNQLDSSANSALKEIYDELSQNNIELLFSNVKGPVRDILERSEFAKNTGEHRFFLELHESVMYAKKMLSSKSGGSKNSEIQNE